MIYTSDKKNVITTLHVSTQREEMLTRTISTAQAVAEGKGEWGWKG